VCPIFDKKKVLYVVNSLVVSAGGVERRNLEQILHLRNQGLRVDVCVLRHIGPMAEVYRKNGIPVYYFRVYETYEDRKVKFFITNFLKFYFFLLKKRYFAIIGTQPPSHYLVRLASFPSLGRKIYTMERGNTFNRKKKYSFWDRLFSFWTKKSICVSRASRDGLIETSHINPKKLAVIEEGYKKEECLGSLDVLKKTVKDKYVFGCVGSFIPTKRHDILIKAFCKIHETFPETRLIIVGDGELAPKLHLLVEELRIEKSVIFTGVVDNTHCYYPLFDAFVFPSISEGLGGVFVEAWLHFLPVICSDMRPMKDYIDHMKNGLLFAPDDVGDLSKWMKFLILNREKGKELGWEGNKTARETFDYEKQLDKLYKLMTLE